MILTNTPIIEGKRIIRYLGIVTGEVIMGTNVFKDVMANFHDTWGGRVSGYEKEFRKARGYAIEQLMEQAQSYGANAVVGISIDHEVLGKANGILMVAITGTAVLIEE